MEESIKAQKHSFRQRATGRNKLREREREREIQKETERDRYAKE